MRYYIVSDLHGFYDLLIESLEEQGYFKDIGPKKLVILGDILDRGNQANKLVDFISDLIDKDEVILIKGNHEDLMERLIEELGYYYKDRIDDYHYRNSTVDSLCQLTNCDIDYLENHKEEIKEKISKHKFITKIIPKCLDYYETSNYIFVHGYIPMLSDDIYGRTGEFYYIDKWREVNSRVWEIARWFNGIRADTYRMIRDKTIICGHWHCSYGHAFYENDGSEHGIDANYKPFYRDQFICIDGCVPRSKHVNCIIVEDD